MPFPIPTWLPFQNLSSASESVSASAGCSYSLGTLEFSCRNHGVERFALTEQEQPDNWRWAIFSVKGSMLGEGHEHTQAQAKIVAEQALESARTRMPFPVYDEAG